MTNKIYCGDNLPIMDTMSDESVDLIYLDPPFFSGRNYEVIWGDEAEIRSFKDRHDGEIMNYIGWMSDRLKETHRILKSTGSIYLHCDWHASHYLKVEMDKIFGINNFQNEIIWSYEGGGRSKNSNFARKHDNIFLYSKSGEYVFNMKNVLLPHTQAQLNRYNIEKNGKRFANMKGKLRQLGDGKIPSDTWTDISPLSCNEKERLGYPTQKPEALLERIIKASSNTGDIIMDPFAGCGTSSAVAQKLDRQFIGIDISPIACKLISKRVNYPIDDIIGLPRTPDEVSAMEPHEFQNWVCNKLSARNTSKSPNKPSGGDGGIDGIIHTPLTNPTYNDIPIQVKQSKSVGVNTVKNFFASMHDIKKETGFIIAISFGKGAKEQVAKYKNEGSVTIHLLTVEDIVDIQNFNDIVSMIKK